MLKKIATYTGRVILLTLMILMVMRGTASAVVFNLRAEITTKTMPDTGEVVTMWGFGLDANPVTVPGPTLVVPPGDSSLTINLTNNLPVSVSLVIPGQQATLNPTWVGGRVMSFTTETLPNGGTGTYTWNNLRPGTYLYESGTNPAVQVQMGLYGGMKKDLSTGQAYNNPSTAYDNEVILLYSEIDPALHSAVATGNYINIPSPAPVPGTSVTSAVDYHPKYFLINGAPYSSASLPVSAGRKGDRVLIRFLNAGLETHVPIIQGLYMTILAEDGYMLPYPKQQYGVILPAGKTNDAIMTAAYTGNVPVYDRRLNLTNAGVAAGGMLTYLNVLPTYSISGAVTLNGTGLGGVTVTLSGGSSGSTTTDASGNYTFTRLVNGNYAVTPSLPGYTFSPASRAVTISGADQTGIDFAIIPHSISGQVTLSATGLSGVTMTLSGGVSATTTTDSSGNYTLSGLLNGNYTVTPSLAGYIFTPASSAVSVLGADQAGINFAATALTYSISGTITSGAAGLSGVTIIMTLAGTNTGTTITDASGNYTFTGLLNGIYTVTPGLAGYTFSPLSRAVTISGADQTGVNFTATANTYSISGQVTLSGTGLGGVTMVLSGGASASTTTDTSGNFTFTGLTNGNYTVTPGRTGYTFGPASTAVAISGADQTGVNFAATAVVVPTYSISGTVTLGGTGLSGVTMVLSGGTSATTTTNTSGNYTLTGLTNGSYAVTPGLSGYTFSPASTAVTISGANRTGISFTATANTYSISGTVTLGGTGFNGVAIILSGGVSASTITDSSGNFTFAGLTNGSYTVTPSLSGYTFTPASSAVTIAGANQAEIHFAATADTYSISGQVTLSGTGLSGVSITLSGANTGSTTTDALGNYTFTGLINGSYAVTPSLTGYTFTPASSAVTIAGANQGGVNFAATADTYSISGQVTLSGTGLSGVTVTLSGTNAGSAITDSAGNYTFAGLTNGSYTVTPNRTGYTFSPANSAVTIANANQGGVNFAATALTYSISGQVTLSGTGLSGVTITLSGAGAGSTTTDTSGNYTFTGLTNGSYTVTPSRTGNTFSPVSTAVTVAGANQTGINFIASAVVTPTYSISGQVTLSGTGLSGVTITLSGAGTGSTTTDVFGNYTLTGLSNGSYTVTPSLVGSTFTPANRAVAISNANQTGINFTATALTYSISGKVTLSGTGLSGVTITLSGAGTGSTTTDTSGNYTFTGLGSGSYTVTPGLTNYTFSLVSRAVIISGANQTGINFTATAIAYSISGQVTLSGTGLSGVTVTLSGTNTGGTVTDASGNYSFAGLTNGSYTVTPGLGGYSFSPASSPVTIASANQTGVNFTATVVTYSISGNVNLSGTGFGGVSVTLSGTSGGSTTTDASGNYSFTGLGNGIYTVTPGLGGYTFSPASTLVTIAGASQTGINFTASTTGGGGGGGVTFYSISGTVTLSGTGLSGVIMTLSGSNSGSTITDASGNYSFTSLGNGSYTVTPSLTNFTFSPVSAPVPIADANQTGINFVASPAGGTTYTISGTVTLSGTGLSGVTMVLSGSSSATTTTDSSGYYTFTGLSNGSYTVTPGKTGYTFSPASSPVTISGQNQTGINFAASPAGGISYFISGKVTLSGAGLSGVTMVLSGSNSATTTTDSSGNYTFAGLSNGSYTVTPGKTGYAFSPLNKAVTISGANQTGINFTASVVTVTYSISGKVEFGSIGLSGVTMTLSGGVSATTTTDSSGNYTFAGLINGSYTVTPGKTGYTFSPVNKAVTISGSNKTGIDFTASAVSVTCKTWDDVIAKYNAYVSGQATWDAIVACYNQYVASLPAGSISLNQAATIELGDVSGSPGETIVVPVNIDYIAGKASCNISITFDNTLLRFAGKENGDIDADIIGPRIVEANRAGKYDPIVVFNGEASGTIMYLKFTVLRGSRGDIPLAAAVPMPAGIFNTISGTIRVR